MLRTSPALPVREWFRANGADEERLGFYHGDVGTFWFQVEVDEGGKTVRSRGMEDTNKHGLNKVLRVCVRDGDGLLGYITSFYNVPGVFGSVLVQSKNHLGADCADVMMSAWSRWKGKKLKTNYNVQLMVTRFSHEAEVVVSGGAPDRELKWGEDIHPGDFIAVRYGDEGKKFHHVGALLADADKDGKLSPGDTILHAGPDPLHVSQMSWGAFNGHVVILEP